MFFVFCWFKLYQRPKTYYINYDVKFEDFAEGPGTYSTMCVAADHEKHDSYDDRVTSKYPNLLRNMG